MPSALRVHCSGLNLLAPCEVPIEMASESTPVLRYEIHDVLGLRVGVVLGRHVVLHAGQHAQLALHGHVELVRVVHHLLGQRHVLLVGEVAEPSIITDEKPMSIHDLAQARSESPWSRCSTIGMFLPSSLAYSTAPWAM